MNAPPIFWLFLTMLVLLKIVFDYFYAKPQTPFLVALLVVIIVLLLWYVPLSPLAPLPVR